MNTTSVTVREEGRRVGTLLLTVISLFGGATLSLSSLSPTFIPWGMSAGCLFIGIGIGVLIASELSRNIES